VTLIELITQALRKVNIIAQNATPSAGQAAECLAQLNIMFPMWEESDIFLQWYTQTDTAADYPGPDYSQQGVIGALAVAIAGNYGRRIPPELSNPLGTGYADVGIEVIRRKAINRKMRPADLTHLPTGSGWRHASNILTGE
jgi:hypothetical protein